MTAPFDGLRVVELADEQAEYCGLVLAGLGAEVIKVEPPGGNATRRIGPFLDDVEDRERSLFFWTYNRGKKSIVIDVTTQAGREELFALLSHADVFIDSTPVAGADSLDPTLQEAALRKRFPSLVVARMTPFGETGPWAEYRGSDLVHLALGGPAMNCGYTPRPDGTYDLPPIAPQMWHSYHIAGEQLLIGILGALMYRTQYGVGQKVSCAVHESVAKNTELDLMNWVMLRTPLYRQTCTHAMATITNSTQLAHTKDGRWFLTALMGGKDRVKMIEFLDGYGMAADLVGGEVSSEGGARAIPGSSGATESLAHLLEVVQRYIRRFRYDEVPWRELQDAGIMCVPIRRPEENVADGHWWERRTFSDIEHPELGRSFTYATSKWVSSDGEWKPGRRAPLLDEDRAQLGPLLTPTSSAPTSASPTWHRGARSRRAKPMALDGIRILDFTWFLASAGGTRFLGALGAECIKVEWHEHPDTRFSAQAPEGGREARRTATAPLKGVTDPDMGGQFNNKNSGKRGISLNVRHPEGLKIARELVTMSDVVAEGFSPGVMERWGLGYDALRSLRPDVIYAQQSGMGTAGTYGRFRAIGPIAGALSGLAEMSGLPSPAMPAGWGYSYLDWIGAYSFAIAIMSALYQREQTGRGQWIDASQTETGIFIAGTSLLDWSANGRAWQRYGNRSPYKPAAPHGIYRCQGDDLWIAIACFSDRDWEALTELAGRPAWGDDPRFSTLEGRLQHQDQLDAHVDAWTSRRDCYQLMHDLQLRGVAAGACQSASLRCDIDPQLDHLEWLTEVTGTKIGTWPVAELPAKLTETPPYIGGPMDRGAPCYGEDNEYVLGQLLGYSTSQITQWRDDGVI
jgi:crotonobetainyl-CoA:carnitine CoA-transferase CaiB-like acyl-CoA transferase